ncbi:hypothetical protein ACYX7E_14725 [Luteimonas sp. RIT-PG2_3]
MHADVILRDDGEVNFDGSETGKMHGHLTLRHVQVLWRISACEDNFDVVYADSLDRMFAFPTKQHLRDLVRFGLIESEQDDCNRRRKPLKLTERGQHAVSRLLEAWKFESHAIFEGYPEEAMRNLVGVLRQQDGLADHLLRTYRRQQ